MDGHLLDTNIICALASTQNLRHAEFKQEARNLSHVWLPIIAIAEIEFGMAKTGMPDEAQQNEMRRFLREYPQPLGIGDNTVEPYALLRSQLWKMFATPTKRSHKEIVPEELFDKVTGKQLGIDERDLLIASTAAENGLILVTNDSNAGMTRIEEAAKQLGAAGKSVNLRISYW